jgi:hypothetical protein
MMIFLAMGGAAASWYIQEIFQFLHLRGKLEMTLGWLLSAEFLILGFMSNCIFYALGAVAGNLLIGYLAAYSGRRTENGIQIRCELLGLRHHMKNVSKAELMRIMQTNTDYYYELAPYALAMGVDKPFAQRFGSLRQPACNWLIADMGSVNTATEWYPVLRNVVKAMDTLQKRPPWEKLLNLK